MKKCAQRVKFNPGQRASKKFATAVVWMLPNTSTGVISVMKRLCAALKRGVFPPLAFIEMILYLGFKKKEKKN